MIELSNGHRLRFVVPSGALAFDGRGWPWEWPLRWLGLINPHLFTIVIKTILLDKWKGNLRWHAPWRVLKFLSGSGKTINPLLVLIRPGLVEGLANAIGLTSPGFEEWLERDLPTIQRKGYKVIVSITGEEGRGCVEMAKRLNGLGNIVGIEFNASCPNTDPSLMDSVELIIKICQEIKKASDLPLILKLSYAQPYIQIAKFLSGTVEAISINSVPWSIVYPDRESPLAQYGGGGVSGKVAQPFTWGMVSKLSRESEIPVIGPSIWEYENIRQLQMLGASAFHLGSLFLPHPTRPTKYVKRWLREEKRM